jgi:hypothetical protein
MATPVRVATQEQVAPFLVSSNGSQMHVFFVGGSGRLSALPEEPC